MSAAQLQSTVSVKYAAGIVGELVNDGPRRVTSYTLDSNGGAIGNFFTLSTSTGLVTQGGAIGSGVVYGGFLVNPKQYASFGATTPIDPTLTLVGNSEAQLLEMGIIWVSVPGPSAAGDLVQYNTTTGAISTVSPGSSATTGNALVPNAIVWKYGTTGAGLIAIKVTN